MNVSSVNWNRVRCAALLGLVAGLWCETVWAKGAMRDLVDNALGYVRPGQGVFDPKSGYPAEGWNDDPATGLRLRNFTQLTAIGSWLELLSHFAAGTVVSPHVSRAEALERLEQLMECLLEDQRDPRLAERGLLCNFMGFEPERRVGPLASAAHKKEFQEVFGAEVGEAIWQALKARGWLYAWRDDAGAEIRREQGYGQAGFEGALAPYASPEIRDRILAILDQRVVQLVFGDNANLAASVAKAEGALLSPEIRDNPAAIRIRKKMEAFLEAQRAGYEFLYDSQRGLFRFGWNATDRRFIGWGDASGAWQVGYADYLVNEFRGPTEFVVIRYGFPVDPVRNLGFRIKSRILANGRELFTLAPWEGSAFQALGLSLFMDERSSPGWRAVLENAVRINLDYSRRGNLPGFLSESYSGQGIEYTGRVGIPELAVVNEPPRITNAPSLYTLGVAHEILPREVESFLNEQWGGISALFTEHGPWEGMRMQDGTPIQCQTTAHVLSLILGGVGQGSASLKRYLESKGLQAELARLRPVGDRLGFLGSGTQAATWSAQGAVVWGERGWRGYRLRGEAGKQGAVTWTFPARGTGVSLADGELTIAYRNRGPALRAVIRFEGQAATGRAYGNELAVRFRPTGRRETLTIPLPATPALTSLRQVVLMFEPEAPGTPDFTLVALRFRPFAK